MPKTNYTIPNCSHCGAVLKEKQGKRGVYFTCPNWLPNNRGCEGEIWFPPSKGKFTRKPSQSVVSENDQGKRIIKGIENIWRDIQKIKKNLGIED